jgi:mRNA interferase MazF
MNKNIKKFIKRFQEWFIIKPKLDTSEHKPPFFSERDIWWCRLGENIGIEISGKGQEFARPVIVLKKFSQRLLLIIPTTTKLTFANGTEKEGERFIKFIYNDIVMLACLEQVRTIDYRRLKNKLGQLDKKDFNLIHTSFQNLFIKK